MRRVKARKIALSSVERQKVLDHINMWKSIKKHGKKLKATTADDDFWAKGLSLLHKNSVEHYFDYKVPANWREIVELDHFGGIYGQLHFWR